MATLALEARRKVYLKDHPSLLLLTFLSSKTRSMDNKYNPLCGKKLVVLGGSSGVGLGVAELSLDRGMKVFIGSSSADKVAKAVSELKSLFPQGEVEGRAVDATSEQSVLEFIQWVAETGDTGIDHLVFTAGDAAIFGAGKLADTPVDDFKPLQEVRYYGALRVVKAAQPHWNPGASMVLTSGNIAVVPPKGLMLAVGGAASIDSLSRGLAVDLAPLRVNCVLLGAVLTPLWDVIPSQQVKDAVYAKAKEQALTKSVGTPLECAHAYLFLMSSGFATGSSVTVDGGSVICRA